MYERERWVGKKCGSDDAALCDAAKRKRKSERLTCPKVKNNLFKTKSILL